MTKYSDAYKEFLEKMNKRRVVKNCGPFFVEAGHRNSKSSANNKQRSDTQNKEKKNDDEKKINTSKKFYVVCRSEIFVFKKINIQEIR